MADYARAELLRELREAAHMSRERVAAEIGVTTRTLYAWENGGKIRWPNAKKIAGFYGVDPESLVSRDIASNGAVDDDSTIRDQLAEIRDELAEVRTLLAQLAQGVLERDLQQAGQQQEQRTERRGRKSRHQAI